MRSEFEYSRDINTKQIELMKTMEMSLTAMTKQVDKFRADMENAEMRAQACQSGTAQAQAAYGSAHNNLPAAYGQATEAGQFGVAQAPAASAVIHPYAYFPADAYHQVTHPPHYAYADTHPMARHQVVRGSGYASYYPGADYGQNDTPYYYGLPYGVPNCTGYPDPAGCDQKFRMPCKAVPLSSCLCCICGHID